jgi:ssDNA-binding Zn-finger/Zn-ribbon topoisomerase 1
MSINISRIVVGSRLRLAPGHGTGFPDSAVAEVTGIPSPLTSPKDWLNVRLVWKDDSEAVVEATKQLRCEDFVFGVGRLFLPGEAPPKKGDSFGVKGQNNDYSKLRRQGLKDPVAPSPSPSENATMIVGTNATPNKGLTEQEIDGLLNPVEKAGADTQCPHCSGTLRVKSGHKKDGTSYAFVGCDNFPKCRASIRKDGTVVNVVTGLSMPITTVRVPSPSVTTAVETTPTPSSSTTSKSTPAVSAKPTYTFPADLAMKLAADVRKMQEQGTTEMTISLRKVLAWATASTALAKQGMNDAKATAGGFILTVLDREVDDSREVLRTLYRSYFSFDVASVPRIGPMAHHEVVKTAIDAGLNLWLSGPTGSGKTYTVLSVLREMGREYIRFQGGGDVTRETLLGFAALENGTSTFRDGPLTIAARKGLPLVLDEFDKLRDEVQSELAAVLEGNALVLSDNGGERIDLPAGFCIVATANSVGRGEGMLYSGTRTVNEAIRDRFIFMSMQYDNQRDLKVLLSHIASL